MSARGNLPRGWRTDPALAGLGTLNNLGVHALDVLRYLVGSEVGEVAALVDSELGAGHRHDRAGPAPVRQRHTGLCQRQSVRASPPGRHRPVRQ